MTFLTVNDCLELTGPRRDLLREFDYLLRDILAATRYEARGRGFADAEAESACVTVLMSVAAAAALAAAVSPADVTESDFAAVARDALAAAKRRTDAIGGLKH
jgi:hypothetical protein